MALATRRSEREYYRGQRRGLHVEARCRTGKSERPENRSGGQRQGNGRSIASNRHLHPGRPEIRIFNPSRAYFHRCPLAILIGRFAPSTAIYRSLSGQLADYEGDRRGFDRFEQTESTDPYGRKTIARTLDVDGIDSRRRSAMKRKTGAVVVAAFALTAPLVWTRYSGQSNTSRLATDLQQFDRQCRAVTVIGLLLYAGAMIFTAVEPFAHGLETIGLAHDVPPSFTVQWIAPLASESPELIVVAVLVNEASSTAGFNALISSKLDQWTLLIGTPAVVYSIALGQVGTPTFDTKQSVEIWLTAARSLFALAILINFEISVLEAVALLACSSPRCSSSPCSSAAYSIWL